MKSLLSLLILIVCYNFAFSQDTLKIKTDTLVTPVDTLLVKPAFVPIKPEKAALRSAILPGYGQFSNKSYWKVPIATGSVAAGIYFWAHSAQQNNRYTDAILTRLYDTVNVDEFAGKLELTEMFQKRNHYANLNTAAILGTVYAYGINVLDAFTDAQMNKLKEGTHSPTKAAFYSALLPGLGQLYNDKYWKLPIVYAAIGTGLYFSIDNSKVLNDIKIAYATRVDGDTNTFYETEFTSQFESTEELGIIEDQFSRFRDISFLVTAALYFLNIIDAVVDAHLYGFNMDDDLSIDISPEISNFATAGKGYQGIRITLKF